MNKEVHNPGEKSWNAGRLPARVMVLSGEQDMLGWAMAQELRAAGCELILESKDRVQGWETQAWCRHLEALEPDLVINTLSYTDPDLAEQEPRKAFYWNKELPRALACAARTLGVGLVFFSSDCVFDGKHQTPYTIQDMPNPLSVYGQSFWAGERALLDSGLENLLIIRSSWLFGPFGPNFVDWVLNQGRRCQCLYLAHDQIGSPTYSKDLAAYALRLLAHKVTGIHHVCNSGQASWCELAAETLNACGCTCKVQAVHTRVQDCPSPRPLFSVLDSRQSMALAGTKARPWPQALREYIFRFHPQEVQSEDRESSYETRT
ncbi:MAG: sugar nucleotide-binding protein [Desulfovermiculus sp.]